MNGTEQRNQPNRPITFNMTPDEYDALMMVIEARIDMAELRVRLPISILNPESAARREEALKALYDRLKHATWNH